MAEEVLRYRGHYTLAKLLAFYCWATEEDSHGRMRKEREKTWSTGRRLVLFTTKAQLPEGWREMFPEFAAAYGEELFGGASPLPTSPRGEGKAPLPNRGSEGNRGLTECQSSLSDRSRPLLRRTDTVGRGVSTLPEGWWRLLSIDKKTLWDAMQAARKEVSEMEYKHWIEPAACADIVEKDTLIIPYYGKGYGGQNPMQATAFLALLKELRKRFGGRIANARAEWK